MKKKYSLGGIILKDGNSVEFKTGDWKNKYPYHDKEKCKNCMMCVPYCPEGVSDIKMENYLGWTLTFVKDVVSVQRFVHFMQLI